MKRMDPEYRKIQILNAAIQLSISIGYNNLTRDKIADEINIASSLIANYYPRMSDLRSAVMNTAISNKILTILAQGISNKDPIVKKIPKTLKQEALDHLMRS